MRKVLTCAGAAAFVAASIGCSAGAASAPAGSRPAPKPIVTVTRHGGLCVTGTECRSTLRIGDKTISGDNYVSRRLKPSERLALLRAIRQLDPAYLASHPFKGTCPTAYDGSEAIYRFRGFSRPLASCAYDLRGVKAVQLVERLIGTLRPRTR
jgi:hypothetical protein